MSPLSRERGQTVPEFFWPRQKSHRLFLPGEVILFVLVTKIKSPQNSPSTN